MHFVNAKSLISSGLGMNIYRGCTHGCIYCDSRSDCYQFTHDFEDIEVKQNAPELLEDALRRKRKPCMIGTGSMCDPYMHCELELGLTRKCLEIVERYGCGIAVQTKSSRVLRDMDILKRINERAKTVVQMTLTTYDESLCRIIEPNVSTTRERYETLKKFQAEGIPTVVWLTPTLPFIIDTEENLRGVLDYCFDAGVKGIICFHMGVTLRSGNRQYFYKNLDEYMPGMSDRYRKRYGNAYECISDNAPVLWEYFDSECRKHGVIYEQAKVFEYMHAFPDKQVSLFDV